MKAAKHAKIKNTGILYELLTRQISTDVINGNLDSKALKIVKDNFTNGTEIQKELELYQLLLNHKFNTESKASTLVETVISARKKLNNTAIRRTKYNIIKEIKESYPVAEFFSSVIPNYTQYASVYKLFEDATSKEPFDPVDIGKSRHTLIEHICNKNQRKMQDKTKILSEFEKQPEDVRLLTTKILIDKFNTKYSVLSLKQKTLLREFINNTQNSLKKYMEGELQYIKKELVTLSPVVTDKVVQIKLHEVINQLDKLVKGRDIKDESVSALLGYYSLIDELRSLKNEPSKT